MTLHSYIKLQHPAVSIDEVRKLIEDYRLSVQKTGKQLDYAYEENAFPYSIFVPDNKGNGDEFYLSSKDPDYHMIRIGMGEEPASGMKDGLTPYIEISLEQGSTFADKGKANELAKYMAKKLQGNLQLFNGRIMRFHK